MEGECGHRTPELRIASHVWCIGCLSEYLKLEALKLRTVDGKLHASLQCFSTLHIVCCREVYHASSLRHCMLVQAVVSSHMVTVLWAEGHLQLVSPSLQSPTIIDF